VAVLDPLAITCSFLPECAYDTRGLAMIFAVMSSDRRGATSPTFGVDVFTDPTGNTSTSTRTVVIETLVVPSASTARRAHCAFRRGSAPQTPR
jgi:hypothetical protein